MLTGGRSVGHAERLISDPSATILFVGYQGEGTLGGHLVRGVERARINGKDLPRPGFRPLARRVLGPRRRARAARLARRLHPRAGEPGDPGVPRDVYLVHGDPPAQAALLPKVAGLGFRTTVPAWLQTVSLD